jgi:hypothetical protein
MSFDKPTRTLLAKMVAACRKRLADDVASQLQSTYGLYPDGTVLDVARTADERHAAADLRALWQHLEKAEAGNAKTRQQNAYQRLVREIGFTLLNRLAALRLAEERGLLIECVRRGLESDGFQLFDQMANGSLGSRYATYRAFLDGIYAELALDLGALFDRSDPRGLLFPGEAALTDLLAEFNHPDLAARALWQQDETIGWIYQYYNDPAERKQMRDASQAPRNSRELAVRNQFFTPRYVVEFLTDNTLGRIWYEMTAGRTQLAAQCCYLVRRPGEVFVGETGYLGNDWGYNAVELACQQQWRWLPDALSWNLLSGLSLALDGDDPAIVGRAAPGDARPPAAIVAELAAACAAEHATTGAWRGSSLVLWLCLFEAARRHRAAGSEPGERELDALNELFRAWRAVLQAEAEETDQQALLRQPVYVARRRPKDPRTIIMLDPAGGSGHFGLYCFDLYEVIYAEAYDDPDLGPALQAEYPDRDAYLREVPRLIIEHNIHIIDIDPRACQIAALALWLRAQRSWQMQGVPAAERPRIRSSNVVTAEPMPGDRSLLDEFVATLHPPVLGDLVRGVFDKMQLAGEAGSLLKIETELAAAIAQAQAQWEEGREVQAALLPELAPPRQGELFDVSNIDDAAFWKQAEARVLAELARYAGQHDLRHRLFAGDAARGFAFIDVCRKRYDVVLMNPPFGAISRMAIPYVKQHFPDTSNDLYAAFIARCTDFMNIGGRLGAITDRMFLILPTFEKLRTDILSVKNQLQVLADLWYGVLDDAMNRTCAHVSEREGIADSVICFDLKRVQEKDQVLTQGVQSIHKGSGLAGVSYIRRLSDLSLIPRNRFAFWAPPEIIAKFRDLPALEPEYAFVRVGLQTVGDERYLRLWYEVSPLQIGCGEPNKEWSAIAKGGEFSPFYAEQPLVARWGDHGSALKSHMVAMGESPSRNIRSESFYFQSGVTFANVSTTFYTNWLNENRLFTIKGPAMLASRVHPDRALFRQFLLRLCALTNSTTFHYMLGLVSGGHSWDTKAIGSIPVPKQLLETGEFALETIAEHLIALCQKLSLTDETSVLFCQPWAIGIDTIENGWREVASKLKTLHAEAEAEIKLIDSRVAEAYGLSDLALEETDTYCTEEGIRPLRFGWYDLATGVYGNTKLSQDLISYMLGCCFGRWDIRVSHTVDQIEVQIPFLGPLPVTPPGMLRESAGLPDNLVYPLSLAWDGILVDDPGLGENAEAHPTDIVRRVREALAVLWPATPDAIEAEACAILGVRELRDYFRKPGGFFADHLKRYSKSRRQAPIYWPLSTASGRYTVWLYYHRLNGETLYTMVNRYVEPKIAAVERALAAAGAGMVQATGSTSVKLREQADDLRAFRTELDAFRGELLRVAGLPYQPNLNDGVLLNAAPLHRLFGLRRWAKDTEAAWRKLEAGEYDWAHMAYTIWPARVRDVCRRDRSIAIAHGLEELCEVAVKVGSTRRKTMTEDETAPLLEEDEPKNE